MTTEALPVYPYWDKVPAELMTKTQLSKEHLKPGGPPIARVEYTVRKKLRSYDLYDKGTAIQKVATPAQLAALEQARIKTRTCSRCGTVVERPSDLSPRGRCGTCLAELAAIKRTKELDGTIAWARSMLANPDALILDTETVDLHDYICEIGVIKMDGTVVFDNLINPQVREIRATHIHGITRDMVWNAPTFADVEPDLRRLLHGKTVVVYNAEYDSTMLGHEVKRMCTPPDDALLWLIDKDWSSGWPAYRFDAWDRYYAYTRLIQEHAAWWRDRVDWQCAMLEYSCYVGEWHDYYRNYRYQALGGGHRAVGDCLACLEVIKRMAATPLSSEKDGL